MRCPIPPVQNISASQSQSQIAGLERSCAGDWVETAPYQPGIQRIEAFFSGNAYAPHRHDTYSIGYTMDGVQSFDYRGTRSNSTPGQVIVLHPDELHNGQAGSDEGFHYRMLYVEPALVWSALGETASALPFAKDPVLNDPALMHALHAAYSDMAGPLDPIALDEIATLLADGLLAHDQSAHAGRQIRVDSVAVCTAREFLDANLDRTVRSEELEAVTGHDRFALSRQFRTALGTSPYRYMTMRRLDKVRASIESGMDLADVAALCGFSDQAHMTRKFTAAFGLPPGKWKRLSMARSHW